MKNPLYHELDRLNAELEKSRTMQVFLYNLWSDLYESYQKIVNSSFKSPDKTLNDYCEAEEISARIHAAAQEYGRIHDIDIEKEKEALRFEFEQDKSNGDDWLGFLIRKISSGLEIPEQALVDDLNNIKSCHSEEEKKT